MLRVPTPLADDLEKLVHDTIGCCIAVHRGLGPGLLENIYSKAVGLELTAAGISFEREKRYPVMYRGELLCLQWLNYMRVSQKRVGLLMNFNVAVLKDGINRKVL